MVLIATSVSCCNVILRRWSQQRRQQLQQLFLVGQYRILSSSNHCWHLPIRWISLKATAPVKTSYFGLPLTNANHRSYIHNIGTRTASDSTSSAAARKRGGARPLYFQQSPPVETVGTAITRLITPYDLLGTASALPPQWRHLSPCFGAALSVSPLLGNLMRLGQRFPGSGNDGNGSNEFGYHHNDNKTDLCWSQQLFQIGFLANNLFFQLIRESPTHGIRNKSMPASYLTPGIIGCFLSHSLRNNRKDDNIHPKNALSKDLRKHFGIKSNKIHNDQWTGISLARWMDLLVVVQDKEDNGTSNTIEAQGLVSALWLMSLWGLSPSKDSLVEYYQALDQAGIQNSFREKIENNNATAVAALPVSSEQSSFTENDITPEKVGLALDRIFDFYQNRSDTSVSDDTTMEDDPDDASISRSFELVCAAIILQRQPQPFEQQTATGYTQRPNGYYTFDGGATKADCVEVTIREIIYLLLWDDIKGELDAEKLPDTKCPKLQELLRLEQQQLQQQGKVQNTITQQELGQAWFDLLSDLPDCDYLALSPNGKGFELAPTIESISKVLWHLLLGGGNHDDSQKNTPWTSLYELVEYWNSGNDEQEQNKLLLRQDLLEHCIVNSDNSTKTIQHEIVYMQRESSSRAMEIRLRCDWEKASGMAAVTHLTTPRNDDLFANPNQIRKLQDLCFSSDPGVHSIDPSLLMLCLALQPMMEESNNDDTSLSPSPFESWISWLATPYGVDRRELCLRSDDTQEQEQRNRENDIALMHSRRLLKTRILDCCRHVCRTHPRTGAHLLCWLLQESPTVVDSSQQQRNETPIAHDEDIERALWSLPRSILDNEDILEGIEWNWALSRGKSLSRFIRWKKLERISFLDVLAQSTVPELPGIATRLLQYNTTHEDEKAK